MSVKTRGIGKCVGSAVWLALLSLLSVANSATAEPPANLLARPGFEAAEAALKTTWYPFEAGGYVNYEGSSEAYEIPARVIEMRRRLPGLLEKTATLEGLVNEAESKGLDASLLRVSLSVAKVFTPLLAEDASSGGRGLSEGHDRLPHPRPRGDPAADRVAGPLRGRPDRKGPGPGDRGSPGDPEEPGQPEEDAAAAAQAGHRRERGLHVRREADLPLRHPRTGRRG